MNKMCKNTHLIFNLNEQDLPRDIQEIGLNQKHIN